MAQAFTRAEVLVLKLLALGVLVLVAVALGVARWSMAPQIEMQDPVAQPIPFSHKHHVSDDGIDCRYCHASVETSAFAGMPATSVCLTCHSVLFRDAPMLAPLHASLRDNRPLAWTRVHDLPDFVYFDHSIHVAKGVACQECHGRVDQMPLTRRVAPLDMQWCLACHRDPARHLHAPTDIFAMRERPALAPDEMALLQKMYHLQDTRRLTDCSTCHR